MLPGILKVLLNIEPGMTAFLITCGVMALINAVLHMINRTFKDYKRFGFVAFALSIVAPGSGFAYSAAYIRAWISFLIFIIVLYLMTFSENKESYEDMIAIPFVIFLIVQIIWSVIYVNKAGKDIRRKTAEQQRVAIEQGYLRDLKSYVASGHHVAVDTNFLMHLFIVLENLFQETNAHLYLHPTVFGELEGLKGNKRHEVRMLAQRGFDVLEMYQRVGRMQWTRKQRTGQNFTQADQRIVTGVLAEIQAGTKLVFASHDKGARILARSLNIPVVDPIDSLNNKKIS